MRFHREGGFNASYEETNGLNKRGGFNGCEKFVDYGENGIGRIRPRKGIKNRFRKNVIN